MLLNMLREPGTGRPAPLARMVALVVVLGLVCGSAVALAPVVAWVLALL